jgi:CDP-6-deoxy-D-xylo-4-hexulose-3-dehydrase
VFVDIELDTLNFDLNLIESKITRKTKAIFVSPVLGNISDMDRIVEICHKHNLELILDNCDSLGSKWKGKYLNEYAVASSCSFYAAHEICTFEGGMVSTNNAGLINVVKSMTNWGRACICSGIENLLPNGTCNHRFDNWIPEYNGIIDHKYVFTNMGYNVKPLELSGAVGVVQVEKLDEICSNRKNSKKIICEMFEKHIDGIRIPTQSKHSDTVWFGSPIICKTKEQKESLVRYLENNKIQTRNYFAGNILIHPGYKHLGNYKEFPFANVVLDRVFFVGASPSYRKETFDYINTVLEDFRSKKNV